MLYICQLLKDVKGQKKDNKDYRSDDPSLCYLKIPDRVKGGMRNTHVTPTIILSTPMSVETDSECPQAVCFDT